MKPSKIVYPCWQVEIEFITNEGMGDGLHTVYTARNAKEALERGFEFAEGRLEVFKERWKAIGAIKVSQKCIGPIVNGCGYNGNGWPFFEWKRDHPESLRERVEMEIRQKAKP